MFSGIVDHFGNLNSIRAASQGAEFVISTQFTQLELGESIAIDGVCLTVTAIGDREFTCQLSPETLAVTTAAHYKVGQALNLERALRVGDAMGGHWVTGHVDGQVVLAEHRQQGKWLWLSFSGVDEEQQAYLVQKGSVAINGVSLTVNTVTQDGFTVMLIPHTLVRTNLHALKVGQAVNVEWDYLAKLVLKSVTPLISRLKLSTSEQVIEERQP